MELRAFFNGDWRAPGLQHFCNGKCCRRQQLAYSRKQGVRLLREAILDELAMRTPSVHRWDTWSPTISASTLGGLLHSFLPRVIARCNMNMAEFAPEANADDPQVDPDAGSTAWKDVAGFLAATTHLSTFAICCFGRGPFGA
jgi:hypothetical protein